MKIFRWDRWTDIKEDRINPISIENFKKILKENCNLEKFLYKKIHEPNFQTGLYQKKSKVLETYHKNNTEFKNLKNWSSFPLRENSLVCYNYEESSDAKTFLVFPFKNSLFTISPIKESCYEHDIEKYNKGYWSNQIKWLDSLNEREMWTESDCLVIEKDLYEQIINTDTNTDTDYTLNIRNVLATTLIGEAGGKEEEMKKVMNVLNNRSKRRKSTPSKEALRAKQFSIWNSAYEKVNGKYKMKNIEALKDVIKRHKTSTNWSDKHWQLAYQIVDQNIKQTLPDTTNGATMYYAYKKTKPYWAKIDKFKETIRTPYHAYGKMI